MTASDEIVLKLISLVKEYPALYDAAHEDYNVYHKKIQIWNEIAAQVNYSDGKVAQTKWRNIRDAYVKHLKAMHCTDATKKYRNWQWVEHMAFLNHHLGGNKIKKYKPEDPELTAIDSVESVYDNLDQSEKDELSRKRKVKSPIWQLDAYSAYNCELTDKELNSISGSSCMDSHHDSMDLLFLSHSKTLKSLSKKRQIQVKLKISEIIGLAEFEELEEENEKKRAKTLKSEIHDDSEWKLY